MDRIVALHYDEDTDTAFVSLGRSTIRGNTVELQLAHDIYSALIVHRDSLNRITAIELRGAAALLSPEFLFDDPPPFLRLVKS